MWRPMNLRFFPLSIIMVLVSGIGFVVFFRAPKQEVVSVPQVESATNPPPKEYMIITSPSFRQNGYIPLAYTCDGNDMSPPLDVRDVPPEAKSLALVVDDPDAPRGTWVHWVVWNIPPQTTQIRERSVPPDVTEGETSFGKSGYGGPCPHSGAHRYFFKLYALDTMLDLTSKANSVALEKAMEGHVLEKDELVGLYSREKI